MSEDKEKAPGRSTEGLEKTNLNTPETILEGATEGDHEDLLPNTDQAITVLDNWCGDGLRVLTAIPPDGGRTRTKTFTAGQGPEMREWIDGWQGKWNLYFTVNRTSGAVTNKPNKSDMAAAVGLHVDVDPRPGEPLDSERERALEMLREFEPKPTAIIDSGGGYQGFWMLEEPFELEGEPDDETRHLPIEERNLKIETDLQGDACHNIDRIMRLPGTINVPGEKKRKNGRVPALARVVDADWSLRYRLEDFARVTKPTASASVADRSVRIEAASDVDLSDLPLDDNLKALIVNGADPDDPEKWADRSALVFYVLCEMIRADISDAVMKAIMLDPDYGISAHVLGQEGPDKYADRQIQRALERQPRPGPLLYGGVMDWARAMRAAGLPNLKHHQQEFLDWDGSAYVSVADDTMRATAWSFLESCRVKDSDNDVQPFRPRPDAVSATIDALKAVSHLPRSLVEPPRWLDGRAGPDPLELLPTRSGLLHLPTGDLMAATPELFTRNALDFSHEPNAPEPTRWLAFLHEVWPDDDEADCIIALQEFMGYLLTPDTSLQKALLIPGPKRSGKGTIGRIMGKLVGEANTVAPSLNTFGRSDFGLEPLLAKQLAIVSDMRLSNRTDEAAVAENLLRITGEDRVSVNRKHRSALDVTLRTRLVVMTNEVPRFADKSGALVSRFIVLPMQQSFFGREDTGLTAALMVELPGILNWAVEGWRRVRANGRITQPKAAADVSMQMGDLSSPIPAFVREWCKVGADQWCEKERLFAAFREWHRRRMGQDYVTNAAMFARDLYSAMDQQVRDSKGREGSRRVPGFAGLSLTAGLEAERRDDDTPF